jgi:hypothetical protein
MQLVMWISWLAAAVYAPSVNCSGASWFSEDELRTASSLVMATLKVYVYPNPLQNSTQVFCNKKKVAEYTHIESILPQYFKQSVMFTADPEVADLFLVDHELMCTELTAGLRPTDFQKLYIDPIWSQFQSSAYFMRKQGRDHIFLCMRDLGCFCEQRKCSFRSRYPREYVTAIENMIVISYQAYANTQLQSDRIINHFHMADAYRNTSKDCFRINQDIVIPQYRRYPDAVVPRNNASLTRKPFLFRFRGQTDAGLECSLNARKHLKDVVLEHDWLRDHIFNWQKGDSAAEAFMSLAPAGHGCWSSRLFEAIHHNSIPVIVAGGQTQPFERFLDWRSFSIKLEVPDLTRDGGAVFEHLMAIFEAEGEGEQRKWRVRPAQVASVQAYLDALEMAAAWLSWEETSERSAWHLLLLELACRVPFKYDDNASLRAMCERDDAQVANMRYALGLEAYASDNTPFMDT